MREMLSTELRLKLTLIALKKRVPTKGLNILDQIGRIKGYGEALTKEEEKTLREICERIEIPYDEIPKIPPRGLR
jgi:hypothetical protein